MSDLIIEDADGGDNSSDLKQAVAEPQQDKGVDYGDEWSTFYQHLGIQETQSSLTGLLLKSELQKDQPLTLQDSDWIKTLIQNKDIHLLILNTLKFNTDELKVSGPRTVVASALALLESSDIHNSVEQGNNLDFLIGVVKSLSDMIKLTPSELALLGKFLFEKSALELEGLPRVVREDMTIQTLQYVASASRSTPTVSNRRQNELSYPSLDEDVMLASLGEDASPEDIYSTILALTSPYKASFGNSELGRNNLDLFKSACVKAYSLLPRLDKTPDLRNIAETVVARQLYHCFDGTVPSNILGEDEAQVHTGLKGYSEYRRIKPAWTDRLEMYRHIEHLQGKEPKVEEVDGEFRVVIALKPEAASALLRDGNYLTLHESFRSGGIPDLAARSRLENRLMLLASGMPDDPYVCYGYLMLMRKSHLTDMKSYGGVNIILRPEVLERSSGTEGDSFGGDTFPTVNRAQMKAWELQRPRSGIGFVEVAINGGVRKQDIDDILVAEERPWDEDEEQFQTVLREAERSAIRVIKDNDLPDNIE